MDVGAGVAVPVHPEHFVVVEDSVHPHWDVELVHDGVVEVTDSFALVVALGQRGGVVVPVGSQVQRLQQLAVEVSPSQTSAPR